MLTALLVLFGINILITVVVLIASKKFFGFNNFKEARVDLREAMEMFTPILKYVSEEVFTGALLLLILFGKFAMVICFLVAVNSLEGKTSREGVDVDEIFERMKKQRDEA